MTKSKINIKNFFFASIIIACTLFSSVLGLLLTNIGKVNVLAQSTQQEISLANKDFTDDTVTGNIKKATGWSTPTTNSFVTSGIISLKQEIFEKQMKDSYKLSYKPYAYDSRLDDQVLLINSQDEAVFANYQSPKFTLSENSYYRITFKAYTEQTDTRSTLASANLVGNDTLKQNVLPIMTSGAWQDFTMLVETGSNGDVDANLEFWLGNCQGVKSYGSVLFDQVRIYSMDQSTYVSYIATNSTNKNSMAISLKSTVSTEQFENSNFENDSLTGWTGLTNNGSSLANSNNYYGLINFSNTNYEDYKLPTALSDANLYNNTKALLINNQESASVGYKSSTITIKQHQTYKISFYAYASISSGSAVAKLVEVNPFSEENSNYAKTYSLEITNSTTNTYTNDWKLYSFYIQGRSFEDTKVYLELWLGEEEKAVGYIAIDEVVVSKITSNEFNGTSSSKNGIQCNFGASNEATIKNGDFNKVSNQEETTSYPYGVKDWTSKATLPNPTQSGIINTKDTSMISGIYAIPSTSSYTNNNNILMIGNKGTNAQTYTSTAFSLSADTYYRLSFKVLTQQLTNGASAGFKLYTSTMTLKELMMIESDEKWTTYTLYIKTGLNSYSANIDLSLGVKHNGTGYAFFDDVELSTSTEDAFNTSLRTNSYRVNLAVDELTNTDDQAVNGLYNTNSFTKNNVSGAESYNVKAGVVDTNDHTAFSSYLVGITNPLLPQGKQGNVLMIHSVEDCNYNWTSNEKFALSTGTFYKISVWAYTDNLSQDNENKTQIDKTENYYPYGATISLTEINKEFNGINTNGEWKEYTFYINTTDDVEVNVRLSLGNGNALTKGTVFFTNISVETIEQDTYYSSIKPLEDDDTIDNIMAIGSTKVEDKNDDNTKTDSGTNFDWLILPTLITAVALIIAVVAVMVRKYIKKHPKPVKIGTSNYNRDISLEKDFEHREAIRKQQEKLEKLKQSLEDVKFEIADARLEFRKLEREHKKELNKQVKLQKSQKPNTKQTKEEIKAYKQEQRRIFKEQKYNEYLARQQQLKEKYMAIEIEIEAIYQEELRLIKLYKEYRKQVRQKRKELKEEKKAQKNDKPKSDFEQ